MTNRIRRMHRGGCLIALVLLAYGCGGAEPTAPGPEPPRPPLVTGTIDAAGGELAHADVVLTVPAGAFAAPADLAIHASPSGHPFGAAGVPVFRLTGLPGTFGAPLMLRLRHDLAPEAGDSLAFFLGEVREGHDLGRGLVWYAAAAFDSSGWCVAQLPRGALDLGDKTAGDVHATVDAGVGVLVHDAGRFRIIFKRSQIDDQAAAEVLLAFDSQYEATVAMGFHFGSFPDIWPLDIVVRDPVVSYACYIAAPRGAGFFQIAPELAAAGLALAPAAAHEVLHCAQTFYDPRPPQQWGVLNRGRLWLDEATAAYVEAITDGSDDYVPWGLGVRAGQAPLAGFAGHLDMTPAEYGYGMASFIHYLCEDPGSGQSDERLSRLYDHFAAHGSTAAALQAVLDPPIAAWCVDMQRKLLENRIFKLDHATWLMWPHIGRLAGTLGERVSGRVEAADLGAALAKFDMASSAPPAGTALHIRTRPVIDAQGTMRGAAPSRNTVEALPLAAYGRAGSADLVLLTTGLDSLTLPDWPQLHAAYDDILVLVSRPYSTGPGYTGRVQLDVSATVVPDLAGIDLARFNTVFVETYTDNTYSNGASPMNDQIMAMKTVAWHGGAYLAHSAEDTIRFFVNPSTAELTSWRLRTRYRSIGGNVIELRLAGGPVPLDEASTGGLVYRAQGRACCSILAEVYKSYAADFEADPYLYLTGYSCRQAANPNDGSRITIQLFTVP